MPLFLFMEQKQAVLPFLLEATAYTRTYYLLIFEYRCIFAQNFKMIFDK